MKAAILVIILGWFLFLTLECKRSEEQVTPPEQEQKLSQQDFENQLMNAFEAKDSTEVAKLVRGNRYKIGGVIEQFYDSLLTNDVQGNDEEAVKNLYKAQWLIDLYQDFFKDDYFKRRLKLFQNWSLTQKLKKIKADSLREQAKQFVEDYKFEDSQKLNQKALRIYQNLGDKQNEAATLNSLGLVHLQLTNFSQAEQYLKKSLEINRQLELKRGIIANLDNLGSLYKQQRKFPEALKRFQEALQFAEDMGDESSVGGQWNSLGAVYLEMENLEEAESSYQKALEIADRQDDQQLQMKTLLNFGAYYAAKSQFESALEMWGEGLELSRKSKDRHMQGSFLSNMSLAYRNISEYDSALTTLKIALKLNRETQNRWTEGNTLREIGVNLYLKGQPDSGVVYWQRSLQTFRDIPDTSMMGMLIGYIGVYYKNTGQPRKALDYFAQALDLVRKTHNEREESNILTNMGNVYMDVLAEYSKAEELFREALEIKQRLGEVHFAAVIQGNLGVCHKNRGDYQKALEYYFKALNVARETRHKSGEAKKLSDIASIYTDVCDYQKAFSYYKDALTIFLEIDEKKPQVEALLNLGSNYLNINKPDSAFANYRQALDLAQKIGHKNFEGEAYFYLGEAYQKKGANQQALEHYGKALILSQETNDLRKQGELFTARGEVYYKLQDFPKALANYQKGMQISQKIGSPEGIWKAQYGIGKVSEKLGKDEGAEKNYDQAIETIESIRAKLTAKTLKESFMEDKIDVYHSMITLLLKMGREDDAFKYLERSKARSSLDILSTGRVDIARGITPERLERKKELERKLYKIHGELLDEYSKIENEQDATLIASLEDSLENVRFQHRELLQEIELNHPRYASLIGVTEPLKLKQVQEKVIQPGTVLIEYMVGEDHTIVWVIGENSFVYEKLSLKREDLEMMVNELLQPFRDVKEGKIRNFADIGFDLQLARKLYEQIFRPIEKYLQKDSHLIIVPDGILYYLPFEALVTEIEKKKHDRKVVFSRYENAHYLVEKYAISYSPSASVLDPAWLTIEKATQQEGKLLAFGNPDFGKATKAIKEKKEDDEINFYTLLTRSSRGWIFSELPKAEEEVKAIAKILKPSLFYINGKAKEEYFKEKVAKFPIVHLATHCIVEETQPMYSRIVFAQDDDPAEDGFLHTYEVFNLKLNVELVTLSACETGLGKLCRGEGLIGLTRAFIYAGAPSILVSLWSVDESTGELMKYFYRNLKKGRSKAEALRNAKLRLIKTRHEGISFAHPYLWAPFVLVGECQKS